MIADWKTPISVELPCNPELRVRLDGDAGSWRRPLVLHVVQRTYFGRRVSLAFTLSSQTSSPAAICAASSAVPSCKAWCMMLAATSSCALVVPTSRALTSMLGLPSRAAIWMVKTIMGRRGWEVRVGVSPGKGSP